MAVPAETPEPPYYAVIFTSLRTEGDQGYGETAALMQQLAKEAPGYLGFETAQEGDFEITVSYWRDAEALTAWKRHMDHAAAQRLGRERWYAAYKVRVARVERAYEFASPGG